MSPKTVVVLVPSRGVSAVGAARGHLILRDLPGYPWLPCPICGGTESCDHTGRERARAALPNLYLPSSSKES